MLLADDLITIGAGDGLDAFTAVGCTVGIPSEAIVDVLLSDGADFVDTGTSPFATSLTTIFAGVRSSADPLAVNLAAAPA